MRIIGTDEAVDEFLRQWHSPEPYVEAHTSGSTGAPKEVRLLKSDMLHSAKATVERFALDSSSVLVMPLSASYIAGKMMIVRAIVADCTLIVEPPSNRPLIQAYPRVDLLPLVPSQVAWVMGDGNANAEGVRRVIVGGAPMSDAADALLAGARFEAYATYGMTETCSHVALRKAGEREYVAMPGVSFDVTPDNRLVIVSSGYSWCRMETNDVVELSGCTSFRWLGRADHVINSGGIKLHPEQIEREIAKVLGDRVFYVTSEPHQQLGEALKLVVEDPLGEIRVRELAEELKGVLPRFHAPRRVEAVSSIARTSSGKIIRTI